MSEFKVGDKVRSDSYAEWANIDLFVMGIEDNKFYCSPYKRLHPKHRVNSGSLCFLHGELIGVDDNQPDYNDGNWHGWNGGECPVHLRSKIDAMWGDGSKREEWFAGDFNWSAAQHLIAFRVITPYAEPTPPKEYWVNHGAQVVLNSKPPVSEGFIHMREVTE